MRRVQGCEGGWMASNLTNNLIGKLFDTLRDRLMQTPQPWRWILGILIFAMAVFCALLATTVHDTAPKIVIVIGAGLFLLLALMVLIGNSFVGSSQRRLRNIAVESEARAKQLLAEGKLLPIPPLPTEPPQGVSPEELAQIEVAAAQL